MHDIAARIARAQLNGLVRVRTVVPAGPFTGLITPGGGPYESYAVAAEPGAAVGDVAESLVALRAAFPDGTLRFELIDEAAPGAVAALTAAGLEVTYDSPVLAVSPEDVTIPDLPGATAHLVTTVEERRLADWLGNTAFGAPDEPREHAPTEPVDGGTVIIRVDGEPAGVASWTPVSDQVTEVAGVGTLEAYRRRGLGGLATAHATRLAADLTGVTLAWLTAGGDEAGRVYRRVGYQPVARAVHVAEAGQN